MRNRLAYQLVGQVLKPVEHNFDVSGSDPILEDRAVVEVVSRWSSFQSAECNSGPGNGLSARVSAKRLLLVGYTYKSLKSLADRSPQTLLSTFGYSGPILTAIDFPALTRVVLKGMP